MNQALPRSSLGTAREAGFTLVELLTALAVAALLLSLLSLTLWSLQDRRSAMEETAQAMQVKQQLSVFFNTILAQAVSYNPDGPESLFFEGEAQRMVFFAPPPQALSNFGVLRYELAVDPVSGAIGTTLQSALPWLPAYKNQSSLLAPLSAVSFQYLPVAEQDVTPKWQDRWENDSVLPAGVMVRTALLSQPETPIDFVVKMRRPIDPRCRYDSLSRSCVK